MSYKTGYIHRSKLHQKHIRWRKCYLQVSLLKVCESFLLRQSTRFFYEQLFFSTKRQCCLTFSLTELQMLPRCCLLHKSIIILRHFLYLLYLCPCLEQGLFMSYLCGLFFIFIFIFNRIIS